MKAFACLVLLSAGVSGLVTSPHGDPKVISGKESPKGRLSLFATALDRSRSLQLLSRTVTLLSLHSKPEAKTDKPNPTLNLTKVVAVLQQNMESQQNHLKAEEIAQKRVNAKIASLLSKELDHKGLSLEQQDRIRLAYKTKQSSLERKFKKWHSLETTDIEGIQEAIKAVKNGDLHGVMKARDALQSSMNVMKKEAESRQGHFLHLFQLAEKAHQ